MGDCKQLNSSSEPVRFFTNLLVLRIYVENELFALLSMRQLGSILRKCIDPGTYNTSWGVGKLETTSLVALNLVNIFHDGYLNLFFSIDVIEISQTYHLLMIINNK